MEFNSSLCVLPPQGPLFSGEDECPSRVLQLRSGNVGSSDSEATYDSLKAELVDQYSLGEAPSIFSTPTANLEGNLSCFGERRRRRRRRDGTRQYPWHRDRNFIRYELDSERYRAYRLKSRQSSDQVWPDDVEDCLQYALRVTPPLGRKKEARTDYNNQQGGRNELIRDFILKWTGQERTRKQISSHLQVLKAYLSDNKCWMQLVTAGPRGSTESSRQKEYEARGCVLQPGSNGLSKAGRHTYAQLSNYKALLPPTRILGSNAPPFIHRVDFEMFLEDIDKKRLHTFTSIQSEIGSALRPLEDVYNWEKMYPHLAAYYHRHGRIDSEIILLETNIDLLREHPPTGSTLGFIPFIVISGGVNYRDWRSTTRLYEKGDWVRHARKGVELDKHALKLQAEDVEKSNDTKLMLQIKSIWWAYNVIAEILARISTARAQGDPFAVYQAEQWGRQFLAEMSMMQEISAVPRSGETPQTVAILLWKFRQTRPGETATTTWRRLTPPPEIRLDPSTSCSTPSLLQPPGAFDIMAPDELEWQSTAYDHDGYLGQPNFFVDDPESIITGQPSKANSSSSTPTPDLQSLPSSTATSFASSGSGSSYQFHPFAGSPYAYEDPNYLSQDLHTHSQDSVYEGSMCQSQDMEYERQDIEYLGQASSYPDPSEVYTVHHQDISEILHHQNQPLNEGADSTHLMTRHYSGQSAYSSAEHHNHTSASELLSQQSSHEPRFDISPNYSTAQDFTGGQIQISFAERQHQQHAYEHSLVAPETDMLSRHHSIQREAEPLHGECEASAALLLDRRQSHYSASHDLEEMNCEDGMHTVHQDEIHPVPQHEDKQQRDQSFPVDQTIHRPQPNDLILHHPQPHQSVQHHLNSAQWQTHALWASIHNHAKNDSDEMSPTFDTEVTHAKMLPGVPELIGHELQEPGHDIGEISPAGERDEFERDMEIGSDPKGV